MKFDLRLLRWLLAVAAIGSVQPRPRRRALRLFPERWNVIGLKDYNDGTRITPNNELLLAGGDKAEMRFGNGNGPL